MIEQRDTSEAEQKYVPPHKKLRVIAEHGDLILEPGDGFGVIPPHRGHRYATILAKDAAGETIRGVADSSARTVMKFPSERRTGGEKAMPDIERARNLLGAANRILLGKGLPRWEDRFIGDESDGFCSPREILSQLNDCGDLVEVRMHETRETFELILRRACIVVNEAMNQEARKDGRIVLIELGINPSFIRIVQGMAPQSEIILAALQQERRSLQHLFSKLLKSAATPSPGADRRLPWFP